MQPFFCGWQCFHGYRTLKLEYELGCAPTLFPALESKIVLPFEFPVFVTKCKEFVTFA